MTSLVAQMVKRLSTMRETRVRSLGWEDPLEKEMAIHSSTIAWKIPWTEEPGRLQSMGTRKELDTAERLHVRSHDVSVQFSRSVVSDSLRPHESQHARPPCPSPTPRVHPNSCLLSQ